MRQDQMTFKHLEKVSIGLLSFALLAAVAFAQAARANVHLRVLYGRSTHHQVEALFKAFARALRFAVSRDRRLRKVLPSTKELL